MLSDPIADMLTRIRNAIMVGHSTVAIPYSNTKMAIAQIPATRATSLMWRLQWSALLRPS